MSEKGTICRECGRPYGKHYAGCSREFVDEVLSSMLNQRLAAVYDWASNPNFPSGDTQEPYGAAQIHVLGLLTHSDIDSAEWAEGRYRREADPA